MRKYLDQKYLLVLPIVVILLTFSVYPFASQIYQSFHSTSIRTYWNPAFLGIENYKSMLFDPGYFWPSIAITVAFVIVVVLLELVIGLGVALLVHPLARGTRIITSLLILPMFVAPVFLGALGRLAFHSLVGVVPYYFELLGLPPPAVNDPLAAFSIACVVDVWQWTPFMFLIIHAGLISIPQEIVDAAKIDGASGWNQLRHITLPLLRRVIGVAIIFRTMDAFKTFDIPYVLNQGGPGAPVGATTTVSILTYKLMLQYHRIGESAAIVVVLLLFLNLIIGRMMRYLKM